MHTRTMLAFRSAGLVTMSRSSAIAQLTMTAPTNKEDIFRWAAGAAGGAIALAALGGSLAQGRATAAALEGISRNPGAAPRIQTAMILGLALIESLVLFAWAMAFILQNLIKV